MDTPLGTPYRNAPHARGAAKWLEPILEVECAEALVEAPPSCACCGGDAPLVQVAEARKGYGRHAELRSLPVRYCERCVEHLHRGHERGLRRGAFALGLGLATPLALVAIWTYAPMALCLASGVVAALLALVAFDRRWPPRRVAHECTAGERDAAWIAGFDTAAGTMRVRGTSRAWLDQIAPGAPQRVVRHGFRAPRLTHSVLNPAVCAAGALFFWALTHGEVHFDNPTGSAIEIDVDHGARSLALAAGAHASLQLPAGTRAVVITSADGPVDRFEGRVGRWGDHAVTPFAAGCYGFSNAAYGAAELIGDALTRVPRDRRWHDIDNVHMIFEPLPREIKLGANKSGVTRTRFGRVPCEGE